MVSASDNATFNLNRSSLNPLDNHSYADVANVHNEAGNLPITREEFMEHFEAYLKNKKEYMIIKWIINMGRFTRC